MLPFPYAKKIPFHRGSFSLRKPSRDVAVLPFGPPRRLRRAKATTCCNATAIPRARDLSGNSCRHTAREFLPGPDRVSATDHVDPRPARAPAPQRLGSRDEHAGRHRQNQRGVADKLPDSRQQGRHHRQCRRYSAVTEPPLPAPASINPCHMSTAQLKPLLPSAIGGT
jgi:hypothetical protein